NPGYHVKLKLSPQGVVEVDASGGNVVTANCGRIGEFDIDTWDSFVQGTLFPELGFGPTTVPIFLFYNVVLTSGGGCCILGYHNAFNNPNFGNHMQTYAVADYDTSQSFTGSGDISSLSHEVGEWMDDPNGVNP